jgi:hypothetical protein
MNESIIESIDREDPPIADTVRHIIRKIEREHAVRHYLSGGRTGGQIYGFWNSKGEHVLTLYIGYEDLWDDQRLQELYLTPRYNKSNVSLKVIELKCSDCNYPITIEKRKNGWIYCHCDKCKKRVKVYPHLSITGVWE